MNDPWLRWRPNTEQPWDLVRIAHLHRRAGFMPNWGTMKQSLAQGFERTIDHLINIDGNDPAYLRFEQMSSTIGEAASTSGNPDRLRAWWVFRMLMTPNPLAERMALLWHNHFATSLEKVRDVAAMFEQNQAFRQNGMKGFEMLLRSVVKHHAMLNWLDASANRKEHPNENLGRELMELFTLGEGHYSESDVKEAARCLTGWTIRGNRFAFVGELHDDGVKTVLGHSGKFNGDDLIDLLLDQDATAKRLSWRLCEMFFGEGAIDQHARDQLAVGLKKNNLDIAWGVDTILRSQLFFSDRNIRSRVMSPVEYVVGVVRSLGMEKDAPSTLLLAAELRNLGQDLFHPPNVFGWPDGRAWIHTRSVLARLRFAQRLLLGKLHPAGHEAVLVEDFARHSGFDGSSKQMLEFIGSVFSNSLAVQQSDLDHLERSGDKSESLREIVLQLLTAPENQLG